VAGTPIELSADAVWTHSFEDSKWPLFIALFGAILVHLAVVLVLPDQIMQLGGDAANANKETTYEIRLVTQDDMRFVEANPEAPDNTPDLTNQYSFRNQQAADLSPLEDALNQPNIEGDEDSQKILQGTLVSVPPLQPGVYAPAAPKGKGEGNEGGEAGIPTEPAIPRPAQPLPAPDFIQQEAVAEEGPGSRVDLIGEATQIFQYPDPESPIAVYQPPAVDAQNLPVADGGGGSTEAQPQPRARPRLAPELVIGPLMRSRGSASRRGNIAIDATFSEFGEYQQQFYAAIQTGWYHEIEFFQPIDTATRVHVQLTIFSDGRVEDVKTLSSTASEIATVICESAITKRTPFRPWTREMVQVFGEKRTLNIMFHYR
jgi:hypothetical protein